MQWLSLFPTSNFSSFGMVNFEDVKNFNRKVHKELRKGRKVNI